MHRDENDRLVGARKDVPLVVGIGEGESFLASDVAAILAHTRRIIFMEEGDVADITPDRVTITDVAGRPVERVVETIDWTIEAAEKGGYDTFMLKEIHEQPEALRQSLTGRISLAGRIQAPELEPIADAVRARDARRAGRLRDRVVRGDGRRACDPGADRACRPGSRSARSSGTTRRRSTSKTLVIAVTQSGETADTIAPTRLARERGCPIVAVTNTLGSAITREADAVLFLQAGPGDGRRGEQDVRDPGDDAGRPRGGHRPAARHARPTRPRRRSSPGCAPCPRPRRGRSSSTRPARRTSRGDT